MRITFTESGGYAGLTKGCELDTHSMPDQDAKVLQGLVAESKVERLKGKRSSSARDATVYEISVETGSQRHQVSFDEMNIPKKVEPLLDFLRERAQIRPPR